MVTVMKFNLLTQYNKGFVIMLYCAVTCRSLGTILRVLKLSQNPTYQRRLGFAIQLTTQRFCQLKAGHVHVMLP